jgi:hypothetical protein
MHRWKGGSIFLAILNSDLWLHNQQPHTDVTKISREAQQSQKILEKFQKIVTNGDII